MDMNDYLNLSSSLMMAFVTAFVVWSFVPMIKKIHALERDIEECKKIAFHLERDIEELKR